MLNESNYPAELFYKELGEFFMSKVNEFDYNSVIEKKSVKALREIQEIITNTQLSDFDMIERIVCVFEENGLSSGVCHDF